MSGRVPIKDWTWVRVPPCRAKDMFKSLRYIRYNEVLDQYIYWLEDSDFSDYALPRARPRRGRGRAPMGVTRVSATFNCYQKHHLPIPPNLARLIIALEYDHCNLKILLDRYYPEIEYEKNTTVVFLIN